MAERELKQMRLVKKVRDFAQFLLFHASIDGKESMYIPLLTINNYVDLHVNGLFHGKGNTLLKLLHV